MSKLSVVLLAGLACVAGCRPSHIDADQLLLKQLEHKDAGERVKAAWDLAEYSPLPPQFVDPLLNLLLNDKEPNVRRAAEKALRSGGGAVHAKLMEVFNAESDPRVKAAIANVVDTTPNK